MAGRLDPCVLLALSVPEEIVPNNVSLPRGLRLQTYHGRAFWNLVVCRIRDMRPAGLPEIAGISYYHVAYRLYVEADTSQGKMQGLFFMHSQADNRLVTVGGNLATDFRFSLAVVQMTSDAGILTASGHSVNAGKKDGFLLEGRLENSPPEAIGGTFGNPAAAAGFLKYRPLGLSVDKNGFLKIARVTRCEHEWREHNFRVQRMHWNYLEAIGQTDSRLEMASWVQPIDYRWQLGEIVKAG